MKCPQIYLIESKSRQDLAEMFMRFQEYYESPQFKGKLFSVDDFAHWYASQYGSFTYSKDWCGFNIPSKVLEPFRKGKFDPLTIKEQRLLNICKNVPGDFYILGVTRSAEYFDETVKHEFVHGTFHTNKDYRNEVISCIKEINMKEISDGLDKMGYHSDVFVDETNAYVLVEPETMSKFATKRDTEKLRTWLDVIFKKHFGFSVIETKVPNLMRRAEHVQI